MKQQLGRVLVEEALEHRWRIFLSRKGSKALGSRLDGRALSGFGKGLCQQMVFDIHGQGLMGVGHCRTFRREMPWDMNLQLAILLASVSQYPLTGRR